MTVFTILRFRIRFTQKPAKIAARALSWSKGEYIQNELNGIVNLAK